MIEGLNIDNNIVISYFGKDNFIEIPDNIEIISDGAFKGNVFIKEIKLPKNLKHIGDEAFKGCKYLSNLELPESLESIGKYAFNRCHSFTKISIPKNIKTIKMCSFLSCGNLEYIDISSITKIESQAFLNCEKLKQVKLSSELQIDNSFIDIFTGSSQINYFEFDNGEIYKFNSLIDVLELESCNHIIKSIAEDCFKVFDIKGKSLRKTLANTRNIVVPYGIESIERGCFSDKKGILSITLPETLKEIKENAFKNCVSLSHIIFLNSDIIIDSKAFMGCSALSNITINNSIYSVDGIDIDFDSSPKLISQIQEQMLRDFKIVGTTVLKYVGKEEHVAVPKGVTVIGERAFANCSFIEKITLPETVIKIEKEAFIDCILLVTINLTDSLVEIGEEAFFNCLKLNKIKIPKNIKSINRSVFNRCKLLKEVIFDSELQIISDFAFYCCENLSTIVFPESLESIGTMSFYRAKSLKKISLPKNLKYVGNQVFSESGIKEATISSELNKNSIGLFAYCKNLSSLFIEEGVETLPEKLCYNCESLKKIYFPKTLKYIGMNVFPEAILKNYPLPNYILWLGENFDGDVTIPESIKYIAGGAFYRNSKITSIKFPDSLEYIGDRCFSGAISLKNISIPKNINRLSDGVFSFCKSLESVDGDIDEVGFQSFYGCENLLEIPKNISTFGKECFKGCKNLELFEYDKIFFPSPPTPLHVVERGVKNVVIHEDAFLGTKFLQTMIEKSPTVIIKNILVDGRFTSGKVYIPEGVETIGAYSFFRNQNIQEIYFPSTIKSIEEGAFLGCSNLKTINFSSEINIIKSRAFSKCFSIERFDINVKKIEFEAFSYCENLEFASLVNCVEIGDKAFIGCKSLKKIDFLFEDIKEIKNQFFNSENISNKLSIGKSAFEDVISLESFDFKNVKNIGEKAFSNCFSLKEIRFFSDINIGSKAFYNCSNVLNIIFENYNKNSDVFFQKEKNQTDLEQFFINNRIFIEKNCFYGLTKIESIEINGDIFQITGLDTLKNKKSPILIKELYIGVISCFDIDFNDVLYGYNINGVSVNIPKGVKSIENEVFKDCLVLESIYIPESVENIGRRAFQGTPWLEKIKSNENLVVINGNLIDGTKLKGDIIIPKDVKKIVGWAFANNTEINSICFESNLTDVEEYSFRNCINIKKVFCNQKEYKLEYILDYQDENLPPKIKRVFQDCYHCFKTEIINNEVLLFECSGNLSDIILPKGINHIGEDVFKTNNVLISIVFNDELKTIGKSSFEGCKWLKKVKAGKNLEKIGKTAFSGCLRLESVELSEFLVEIGERVFEHCVSLREINIPEGVKVIPRRAFFRCKDLESVSFPSTLKVIDSEAFSFCVSLKNINYNSILESISKDAFSWCEKL
ncbi:leucine-rich repeat domain-containing protein [bacterium]|nr:leucine-rich repeat domain-containing protein [bacterium]